VPFLEALHLEIHLCFWQWRRLAGGVALGVAVVVVHLIRIGREVRRTHGGVALSWCARCSGDINNDWAEVVLPEQFQVYESLAE
jgi:hypothetical protein